MTKVHKAIARLDKAKAELRAAQAVVDQMRREHMVTTRSFGLTEQAFRRDVAA